MTNKLFIVKYVLFDINFYEKINEKVKNEIDTFFKNSNIESDNRDDFDVINFETISTQDICFLNIAKSVANRANSIEINKIIENVENEVNDEVTNDFENKINSLNKDETTWLNIEIASIVVTISKNVDLNFFW